MIRFKLIHIVDPEKGTAIASNRLFRVYLGNNTFYGFKGKLAAKSFLVTASETATDWFLVANSCLVDCYGLYRKAWPLLDNRGYKHLKEIRETATGHIRNAENALNNSPRFNGLPKANHYVFAGLLLAIRELIAVVAVLEPFFKEKLDAVSLSEIRQLRGKIEAFALEVEFFGLDHPNRLETWGINTAPKFD